ncbi:hypothetical protein K0B03_00435 [Patescibacteria group bacterium]|nr:hypothetical protein [Patescibacteria group bacterium]
MQKFDIPPTIDISLETEGNHEIVDDAIYEGIKAELELCPEIKSDNLEQITEKIIEKLGIKEEKDIIILDAMLGVRANMQRNFTRLKIEKGKEGKDFKILRELAIEDAIWMDKITNIIKSIKNDNNLPEKDKIIAINNIWNDLEKQYSNNQEYFELLKEKGDKYDLSYKANKRGICGQLAAESLIEGLNNITQLSKVDSFRIESSTAEEDVDEKIDFFIIVTVGNNISKIPCQVKTRRYDSSTADFVCKNLITYVKKSENQKFLESDGNKIPSFFEEKVVSELEEFKIKALDKYDEGLFVIIPDGEASYRTGKQKRRRTKINLLDKSGEAHEIIKDQFFKQFSVKFRKY